MPDESGGFLDDSPMADLGWGAHLDLAGKPGGTARWTCTRDELIEALWRNTEAPIEGGKTSAAAFADAILARLTPAESPRPTPGPSAALSADGPQADAGTDGYRRTLTESYKGEDLTRLAVMHEGGAS